MKKKLKVIVFAITLFGTSIALAFGVGTFYPNTYVLEKTKATYQKETLKQWNAFGLLPPSIEYSNNKQPCLEGCLSIPKRRDTTYNRSQTIRIKYDQLNKKHVKEYVSGFTAVIFQHEIDHLNGILYLDHLKQEKSQYEK